LALADQLLAANSKLTGALVLSGDAQLELGRYGGAASTYDKVRAGSPDAPAIEVRQARLLFIEGKVELARQTAAKAVRDAIASALGGSDLGYYEAFRGQVELDSGHYDEGARFYEQALTEAPDYYVALAGMGRARALQG